MATLGADLQHARESAGLSLDDLSSRTKIRRTLLEAIERDDFRSIPGGLLARGYLRAYAKEVGLPAEPIAGRYRTEVGMDTPSITESLKHREETSEESRPHRAGQVVVILLVALAGIWFYWQQRPVQPEAHQSVGTAGLSGPADRPTDGAVEAPVAGRGVAAAPPASALKVTVEINPTRVVWIEATADGKRVLYALVAPGERRVIEAQQELVLRVGDAGAFTYLVNGVSGRELGGPGDVRELRITLQNYASFQKR